jgi:hypothetical protein
MTHLLRFVAAALVRWLRRSPAEREAEIVYLRQQLIVLKRAALARPRLKTTDRLIFVCLYRLFPSLLDASIVFKPDTLLRWHRIGFRLFWRWKSRRRAGRPALSADLRSLVRRISRENPLWGAPRIHGELLKLGIDVAQSTVAKYMVRRRGPPSQSWKTFLRNHAPDIAAIDLFVVRTIGFKLLFGLAIIQLERRHLVWTNVTANPTSEWIARQITEAFPWDQAPPIHHSRQRWFLRSCRHPENASDGHPGSTNCAPLAAGGELAYSICRSPAAGRAVPNTASPVCPMFRSCPIAVGRGSTG